MTPFYVFFLGWVAGLLTCVGVMLVVILKTQRELDRNHQQWLRELEEEQPDAK